MPVVLFPRPAAPAMPLDAAAIVVGALGDPAFDERWTAWRARGDRHELAVRRTFRIVAIVLVVSVTLVVMGMRLFGGTL
jgi:hypothetical protein